MGDFLEGAFVGGTKRLLGSVNTTLPIGLERFGAEFGQISVRDANS